MPFDAVPQLMLPLEADLLTRIIEDGTITKSTGTEMVWQASSTSDSSVKEIHTLAGGEESVVPGRTWVFLASSWDGFTDWATDHADHIADFATIDATAGTVEWKVILRDGDGPSVVDCGKFATAIADSDLPSAMLIASQYFQQDLAMAADSEAYSALSTLTNNAVLYAERLDTSCIGYKFFADYDSPASAPSSPTDTDSDEPVPEDAPESPPDEAVLAPTDASVWSDRR